MQCPQVPAAMVQEWVMEEQDGMCGGERRSGPLSRAD